MTATHGSVKMAGMEDLKYFKHGKSPDVNFKMYILKACFYILKA